MIDKIKEHIAEVEKFTTQAKEDIENFRIKYLGKKGLLNDFFAEFRNVPNEQKKEFGQTINKLKEVAQDKVNALKEALENKAEEKGVYGDLTRPGQPIEIGARFRCLSEHDRQQYSTSSAFACGNTEEMPVGR